MRTIRIIRSKIQRWAHSPVVVFLTFVLLQGCGQSQSLLQGGGITVTNPGDSTSLPNELPKGVNINTFTSSYGYSFRFDKNLKRVSVSDAGAEFETRLPDSMSRIYISAIDPQLGMKSEMDLKKQIARTASNSSFDANLVKEVKNAEGQSHFEYSKELLDGGMEQWFWMLAPNRLLIEVHLILDSRDMGQAIEESFRATIDSLRFDLVPPRVIELKLDSKKMELILNVIGIEDGTDPVVFLYFTNFRAGEPGVKWKGRVQRRSKDTFVLGLNALGFDSQANYKLSSVGVRDLANNWTHLVIRGDDKSYVMADLSGERGFNELDPGEWRATNLSALILSIP